jgi:hypothetical protein
MMAEQSTRTKMIEEVKVDDDMPLIKKAVRNVTLGASKLADKMGFTQEKEYADKSKEELKVKKAKGGAIKYAKGGYVKAADGCAIRGKTRGKMV